MAISAALEVSGVFALAGWQVTRRAHGPLALLVAVSVAAAVLSAIMINDVVCLAFTPLVQTVTETLECDPKAVSHRARDVVQRRQCRDHHR